MARMDALETADGDEGDGIPRSFAFEADDHDVYVRMGYGPDSAKRRFVERGGDEPLLPVGRRAGGMSDAPDGGEGAFEAELERARELLAREDVDGVYAAVVSDDEYEYAFGHGGGDPEQVGMQAMGLLAQHVAAMVEQTGEEPAQVAGDAAMLARTLGLTGEESLAEIDDRIDAADDAVPGDGGGGPGDGGG